MATDGDLYREARIALGLTRQQLAARAHISPKTVQRVEANDPRVGRRYRETIERELGLDLDANRVERRRDRSITEFSDAVLVGELLRRLEERRQHGHGRQARHTDVEDGPESSEGMTWSG